jgi:tetratricopeptide (TPR) repeat protein
MTSYASKTVEYGEMEIQYREAKDFYDNEEWEKALPLFLELAGPKNDHKRAVFYAAKCYQNLEDWENVKVYCRAYLKLKPKDKEVWELLSTAHKRLFEYEDAQKAADKASSL